MKAYTFRIFFDCLSLSLSEISSLKFVLFQNRKNFSHFLFPSFSFEICSHKFISFNRRKIFTENFISDCANLEKRLQYILRFRWFFVIKFGVHFQTIRLKRFFLLPDRPCSWRACPRLVSLVDLSRSFDWMMLVEMAWMVDTWASTRFDASSMAASLLTSSWFPNKMFFSFRTSNWLSKRRNSSWKKISLALVLYLT